MALWEKTTLIACIAGKCVTVVLYRICKNQYYTSISIVQSYSGKYHDCCRGIVQVQSMSNNAKGHKGEICFQYSFVAIVILILSYKH